MKTEPTPKVFDCVEMKRRGQEKVRARLADMTEKEQLAYWHERTEEMLELQKNTQKKRAP